MSTPHTTDELLKLLCSVTSASDFAARHGMTLEEVEALRAHGLSKMSRVLSPQPRRRLVGLIVGLALVALVPATALAQLVSFTADTPARADQVNNNFTQLKTWLEAKVGLVTATGVQAGTLTASSISAPSIGGATVSGTTVYAGALDAGVVSTPSLLANTATINGAVQFAATLAATGTTSVPSNAGTATALRVNGVILRIKSGNNGSVGCDAYCGGGYDNWTGACLGARLPNGGFTADCGHVPGNGNPLVCLCASY